MSAATRLFYKAAVTCRIPRMRRRWNRDAVVFALHNVVEANPAYADGDRSLHVEKGAFAALLDWIAANFDVIPLHEIVARGEAGRGLRGTAAITFDDAYQGVFTHAVPLLKRKGLPATVFVVSSIGDAPGFFWWDLLSARGLLSHQVRERCLEGHSGDQEDILRTFPGGSQPISPDLLSAPWPVVRSATADGITIGSHSRTHRNLRALDERELKQELSGSRTEIAARLGDAPDLIAYPYGRYGPSVLRAAARAGYRGGVTTEPGVVRAGGSLLEMPRVNVPAGITAETLECWVSGIRLPSFR